MSANDIRYGRRGGRALPAEGELARSDREAGLVRVACWCGYWLVTPAMVGKECSRCSAPQLRA